jgi:hypothetical protein
VHIRECKVVHGVSVRAHSGQPSLGERIVVRCVSVHAHS